MPYTKNNHDELLFGYLLGTLPAEEIERLDERSVVDDDFAVQLRDAENDLVDAYVRGKLPAELAPQFQAVYLAPGTPQSRREKVRFAEKLRSIQQRPAAATAANVVSPDKEKAGTSAKRWSLFSWPVWQPQWGMALAALVLLAATGYLSMANHLLRRRAERAEADQASLRQKFQQAGSIPNSSQQENAGGKSTRHALDQLKIAAFVLVPASRGLNSLASITVPTGTDLVVLDLRLEGTEFRQYRVALQDPATREVLWRSPELEPQSRDREPIVSCALRADLLKPQNYLLQVYGLHADSTEEAVSSYSFRAKRAAGTGSR